MIVWTELADSETCVDESIEMEKRVFGTTYLTAGWKDRAKRKANPQFSTQVVTSLAGQVNRDFHCLKKIRRTTATTTYISG